MALFKTAEEKAAAQEEKQRKMLSKFGLENLSAKDAESVRWIMNETLGAGMIEAGMTLSPATKPETRVTVSTLRAIMEQNWIMIRLLSEISEKLDK